MPLPLPVPLPGLGGVPLPHSSRNRWVFSFLHVPTHKKRQPPNPIVQPRTLDDQGVLTCLVPPTPGVLISRQTEPELTSFVLCRLHFYDKRVPGKPDSPSFWSELT